LGDCADRATLRTHRHHRGGRARGIVGAPAHDQTHGIVEDHRRGMPSSLWSSTMMLAFKGVTMIADVAVRRAARLTLSTARVSIASSPSGVARARRGRLNLSGPARLRARPRQSAGKRSMLGSACKAAQRSHACSGMSRRAQSRRAGGDLRAVAAGMLARAPAEAAAGASVGAPAGASAGVWRGPRSGAGTRAVGGAPAGARARARVRA